MHSNASDDREDGPLIHPSPGRAVLAVGVSVLVIMLVWMIKGAGALALIMIPVLAVYVLNVYLGGGLNDSPISGIDRIRTWWVQR
jgi:hypothetical protein